VPGTGHPLGAEIANNLAAELEIWLPAFLAFAARGNRTYLRCRLPTGGLLLPRPFGGAAAGGSIYSVPPNCCTVLTRLDSPAEYKVRLPDLDWWGGEVESRFAELGYFRSGEPDRFRCHYRLLRGRTVEQRKRSPSPMPVTS
jgi:hypothetical protein